MRFRYLVAAVAAAVVTVLGGCAVPVAAASPADVSRVAIIGDSLTRGYGVNPDESYASLLEAQAPGDNVLPLAHDGATVRTWNTVYRSELGQLAGWRPSSVLIALGGNDYYHSVSTVQYQANLTELIGTVRAAVPGVRVILWHYYRIGITPVHNLCDVDQCQSAYPSPTWDQYAAAMRNEAVAQFTGYIDNSVERPWLALYPLPGEFPHIHLSWQGHRALEQSLYPRLFNCC